jgi:hypothetical protein
VSVFLEAAKAPTSPTIKAIVAPKATFLVIDMLFQKFRVLVPKFWKNCLVLSKFNLDEYQD